ncbi:hypothetical protein N7463_001778 [Penicillium fimorum]|uniref:Uncharacterized protein n=1 Tax=Penicillium fimorum TaxID=1882269 RepID=A0A9X0C7W4_9EURO|nr:hypothetical protein N7463_001778 [Penicillium fimorum]
MSNLFCCTTIQPTNHPNPEHEQTFADFTKWALTTIGNLTGSTDPTEASVCIQLVRQIKSGPIESIRYFVGSDKHGNFEQVAEDGILDANFVKMNECKTFQCTQHNRIFDLNLCEPSTGSTHHWRSSIAKQLKQIENALKNEIYGSGHRSGSRSVSGSSSSMRSILGQRTSTSHGYGSGMGYGSGWGPHLGAGCGPNWGTGTGGATVFVPVSTTTTVVAGLNDCEGGINQNQDQKHSHNQDQDQEQDQNQGRDPEISPLATETEYTDKDNNEDQLFPSSPIRSTEVAQDDEAGSYSPDFETQSSSRDDEGASQSYLHIEDYGCYYSGVSSDGYGSYDCGGGDNDVSYDCGDYGDCGSCDD